MSKCSFDGIGAVVATFTAGQGVKGGQVVKVTGNGQVGPCSAGDLFFGVALEPRCDVAGVQVKGFVTVAGTGLAVGPAVLVADGNGGVKSAAADGDADEASTAAAPATGVSATVVSVNEDGSAVICL